MHGACVIHTQVIPSSGVTVGSIVIPADLPAGTPGATTGAGATATAATGPIAFVALAVPHIAQRIFAPTQLPVGVVTGAVGGVYLVWLLSSEWRRKAA